MSRLDDERWNQVLRAMVGDEGELLTWEERVERFAKDCVAFQNKYKMVPPSEEEINEAINDITSTLFNHKDSSWIIEWLDDEIEEYEGDETMKEHVDEANRLWNEYYDLVVFHLWVDVY